MEKEARRALDIEEGKTTLVIVQTDKGEIALRSDYRCLDKDTEVCNGCDLRFECYLSQWLKIKVDDLNPNEIGHTMDEKVEDYVEPRKNKKTPSETGG